MCLRLIVDFCYKLSFIYIIVKIIGEIDVYIRFQLTFLQD